MLAGWKCSLAGYTGSCLLDMLAGWICYERMPDAGSAGCAGCARGRNIKFSKASKNAFQNSRFKPVLSTFLSFWLRIPTGEQMSHFSVFLACLAHGPFFLHFWPRGHFFCTFGPWPIFSVLLADVNINSRWPNYITKKPLFLNKLRSITHFFWKRI